MKRYIYYVLISLLLPLSVVAQTDGYDPVNPPDPNWPDDNTTIYYKVVLEAIPYGSGRFSLNNYSSFKAGETVTVTAQDHNDCYFICWKDVEGNEVTTDRTLQFTMPASDVKYYAIYSYDPACPGNPELVNRYMLSLKCEPAVAGYFSFKDQKVFEGSQQSLYVYRNSGFKFLYWKDADGIILVPLEGGRVQAITADALATVWVSDEVPELPGWDGKPAAHFEHTVAIGKNGPDILTTFDFIENK